MGIDRLDSRTRIVAAGPNIDNLKVRSGHSSKVIKTWTKEWALRRKRNIRPKDRSQAEYTADRKESTQKKQPLEHWSALPEGLQPMDVVEDWDAIAECDEDAFMSELCSAANLP